MKLKLYDTEALMQDKSLDDCETAVEGDPGECHAYAIEHGYRWNSLKTMLLGGYYSNRDGDCLIPR